MKNEPIKTMKLYHQVERVFNELAALGYGADDPIDAGELSAFDQYHYLGTDAVGEELQHLFDDLIAGVVHVLPHGQVLPHR